MRELRIKLRNTPGESSNPTESGHIRHGIGIAPTASVAKGRNTDASLKTLRLFHSAGSIFTKSYCPESNTTLMMFAPVSSSPSISRKGIPDLNILMNWEDNSGGSLPVSGIGLNVLMQSLLFWEIKWTS